MEEHKADKWKAIKLAREQKIGAGFTHNNMVFQSDPVSIQNIMGAVQMALLTDPAPFSIQWTLANDQVVELNSAALRGVGLSLGARVDSLHSQARVLRAQIDAATTPEEVNAIQWPT